MKVRIFISLFLVILHLPGFAQTDVKEIESSIAALNQAMITQDKAVLEKLTDENLSYGHSTGLVENKTEFEKAVLTGPTRFSSIENTNQTIQLTHHVAVVRCISAIKGNNNGAVLDLKIGILMIWQQQGSSWKLLARQGYKLPS